MQRSKEVLLKEAGSADKDLKIMAANDLTHLVLNNGGEVCRQSLEVLLRHLEEPSVDVQGNSVKCISLLTPRMDDPLLASLIEVILSKDIKDIQVTLIKSVINQVGGQQHSMVATIAKALENHINTKLQQNKQESLVILLEVFSLTLSRFRQLFEEKNLLKEPVALGMRLLTLLDGDIKNTLMKQVVGGIQNLLETYSIGQQRLVEAIWMRLVKAEGKVLQMSILMGTALKRQRELRLGNQVIILDTLLRMLSSQLSANDQEEHAFELIEQLVNCLFFLCKYCPSDLITQEKKEEIKQLVESLLSYDPFESIVYMKDQEFQEEEEEYDDYYADMEDDHSWRVRKAGLRMLLWFQGPPLFLDVLLLRMDEQNENVRKAAYDALIDIYEREGAGEGALAVLERLYLYLEQNGQDIQLLTSQATLLGLLHRHDTQALFFPRLIAQVQSRTTLHNQSSVLHLLLSVLIKHFHHLPSLNSVIQAALTHKFIKIQMQGYKLMQMQAEQEVNDMMINNLVEKLNHKQDQEIYLQVLEVVKTLLSKSAQKTDMSPLLAALQNVQLLDAVACINALPLHTPLELDQKQLQFFRNKILDLLMQSGHNTARAPLLEALARTVFFSMDSFSQQDLEKVTALIFQWDNLGALLDNVVTLLEVVVQSRLSFQNLINSLNQAVLKNGHRSEKLQLVLLECIRRGRLECLESSAKTYSSNCMAFYQACFLFNNQNRLQQTMNLIKQQQNLSQHLAVLLEVIRLSGLPVLRTEQQPILCFGQSIDLSFMANTLYPQLESTCKSLVLNISSQLVMASNFQCFDQVSQLFSSDSLALLQIYSELVADLNSPDQYQLHCLHYSKMESLAFSLFSNLEFSSEVTSILSGVSAFSPSVLSHLHQRLASQQNLTVCLNVGEHLVCSNLSLAQQESLLQSLLSQSSSCDMAQKIQMYRMLIKKQKRDGSLFLRVTPLALLAQNVAKDVIPKEDLVKVLNLGPFKHTIDEGQELRSIAYQVVLATASYKDLQNQDLLWLLKEALGQIVKEENEDLLALGLEVVLRLMNTQRELVMQNETALVTFLESQVGRLRRQNNSAANLQRMVLQAVAAMNRLAPSVQLASLLETISASEPLRKAFASLQ